MAESEEIFNLIKKCEVNDISKLTHQIASRLCTKKSINYQSYSQCWSLEEWWTVTSYIEEQLLTAVKNQFTKDEMMQRLQPLSDDYKQCIIDVITVRNTDIHQHLKYKTSQISHNLLTDFDWQMKLVMSSDKYSCIHEPLLNIDLQTQNSNHEHQITSLELNRDDLKKLILSLEGASKAVQQLTT